MESKSINKAQFSRLLAFDASIRNREYPNCTRFARQWEVSRKTIQRDVDYLRDILGAPLEYSRERTGFYYAQDTWFLPALHISEGDLLSMLVGVRALEQYKGSPIAASIEKVFAKVAGLLPAEMSIAPELVCGKFTFQGIVPRPIDEAVWIPVVRGLMTRKRLALQYYTFGSGRISERKADPYHIANLHGDWYLLAYCHKRFEVRQFALSRVRSAKLLNDGFEVRDDFCAEDYLSGAFGRYMKKGSETEVVLRFSGEMDRWIEDSQWRSGQKIKKLARGGYELRFRASGLFEVYRWVLSWGRHCTVLAPKELNKMVEDEIVAMGRGMGAP